MKDNSNWIKFSSYKCNFQCNIYFFQKELPIILIIHMNNIVMKTLKINTWKTIYS